MASHQSFSHRNPEDCGQEIRTEFLLIRDQGPMDSGASNIRSVLCQLDMSQPFHYPVIQSIITAMHVVSSTHFLTSGVRPLTEKGGPGVRPLTENRVLGVRPLTENTETGVNISIVIVLQREVWFNVSRDPERR